MNNKQFLLLVSGMIFFSYAYVIDNMVFQGIVLSLITLILNTIYNFEMLLVRKNNIFKIVGVFFMLLLFNYIKFDYIYYGILFISTINIFISYDINLMFSKSELKNIIIVDLMLYILFFMSIFLLSSIFNINKFYTLIVVSSVFLPILVYYCVLKIYDYIKYIKVYDTMVNK